MAAVRATQPLKLAGIYTHFAASDEEDKSHAQGQFNLFTKTLGALGPLNGTLRHAANSAAVADMPFTALDMVRPGLLVYGYPPAPHMARLLPVRPALRVVSPIVQIKHLPAGATCGYGCWHKLTRDSRIGIVPGGYGDGISRQLSGCYSIGVNGRHVPVLGKISMDQLIVDLTEAGEVQVGHLAVLISNNPNHPNSVVNLARLMGTIPYEVTCRLGRRITYTAVNEFSDLAAK